MSHASFGWVWLGRVEYGGVDYMWRGLYPDRMGCVVG